MSQTHRQFRSNSAQDTADLACQIGAHLAPGDVILLQGDVGAGKTHFARSLIQSRLDQPEDVPSPTFTLVQVYETAQFDIWHADLYRLSGPDEVVELGLDEAFETAICLVEWPDRLGDLAPKAALVLQFETCDESTRNIRAEWDGPARDWSQILPEGTDG
jgi:tRNA threonylcarbamoyladenosine biosynthesis protein TsaE